MHSPEGEYIKHWGGSGDNDDQFATAHGVAIDKRDPNNITLMCTSRGTILLKDLRLKVII
jgi:hypothetical protein